jgi:pyruvate/2-oxoglutarate/acetoin dehydrogenase E1 component
VIIHEACETLGFGAEIAARVQNRSFGYLQAPIERVCAPDVPYSYRVGDDYCRPDVARISAGIRRAAEYLF